MAFGRYQADEYRPQFGGFRFFPPVIKYLIIGNVAAFLLQQMVESNVFRMGGMPLGDWFALNFFLWPLGEGFKVWQLLTYMFLHGGFGHIFLNMLMLWMFGMEVENTWGSKKFFVFYFACGLAAGLANLFIAPVFTVPGPTIGASGGVYGVLVAFAMMFPNRYIYLYFFLPIKAKYLITFFVALEVYNGIVGSMDGVAHIAHLGGAVIGAMWVVLDARGTIDRWFWKFETRSYAKPRPVAERPVKEATFFDVNPQKPQIDPEMERFQRVIDDILDKIGKYGYSALTDEEKRLLLDASRRIHPDKDHET